MGKPLTFADNHGSPIAKKRQRYVRTYAKALPSMRRAQQPAACSTRQEPKADARHLYNEQSNALSDVAMVVLHRHQERPILGVGRPRVQFVKQIYVNIIVVTSDVGGLRRLRSLRAIEPAG